MSDVLEIVTIRGDNITLDLLLSRRFGRQGQAMVERTLELNPGVADLGVELPLGTIVLLPLPAPPSRLVAQPISLFE
jgi:phage tail protein X